MCQFSEIKSHPDLPLEKHLMQVMEIAIDLLESKQVCFPALGIKKEHLKELIKRTALFHDLGKATTFFQERLRTGRKWPNGEHQHAELSAMLAYNPIVSYCKKNDLNEAIALAPLMAVQFHHSEFKWKIPDDSLMDARLKALKKEFFNLQLLQDLGITSETIPINPIEIDFYNLRSALSSLNKEQKIEFRLLFLFIYSLLLEADKAYLAVKDKELYQRNPVEIDPEIVDKYKAEKLKYEKNDINKYREKAYQEVISKLDYLDLNNHIYTLTLPTGMGKTLLAASWAIKLRNKVKNEFGYTPQIIVALPFLSIIDQSGKEYEKFLNNPNEEIFLITHSLSSFDFNDYEDDTAEFFVNIWKSQIVMTTFDQLLYAFFSNKPKHIVRFHNILNSIIIMDEVQALPPHLWHPFSTFIGCITEIGKSYLLLMSATQPKIIEGAIELVPTVTENNENKGAERYFKKLSRYKLLLKHKDIKSIDEFIIELKDRIPQMDEDKIMIVLNTRDSAKKVYENLRDVAKNNNRETYFLSSYVIPIERLNRILQIKNSKRALVITTQCIEAGVDIDMDYIIRDFGPLDSIVQVAGRCNRDGKKEIGNVEIVWLKDPEINYCNGEFCRMVYDCIAIDATTKILSKCDSDEILESQVFDLAKKYFDELKRKDLGENRTNCLLDFSSKNLKNGENDFDIRAELRGEFKQYNMIVDKDGEMKKEIEKIYTDYDTNNIDRWELRRKLKKLSSKIAMNSISVNGYKFNPDEIAEKSRGDFYFLNLKYYDDEIGFSYKTPPGTIIV